MYKSIYKKGQDQFDEKKFRAGQYNEGYFNYHNNPYSLWADDSNKLINNLENMSKYRLIDNMNVLICCQ